MILSGGAGPGVAASGVPAGLAGTGRGATTHSAGMGAGEDASATGDLSELDAQTAALLERAQAAGDEVVRVAEVATGAIAKIPTFGEVIRSLSGQLRRLQAELAALRTSTVPRTLFAEVSGQAQQRLERIRELEIKVQGLAAQLEAVQIQHAKDVADITVSAGEITRLQGEIRQTQEDAARTVRELERDNALYREHLESLASARGAGAIKELHAIIAAVGNALSPLSELPLFGEGVRPLMARLERANVVLASLSIFLGQLSNPATATMVVYLPPAAPPEAPGAAPVPAGVVASAAPAAAVGETQPSAVVGAAPEEVAPAAVVHAQGVWTSQVHPGRAQNSINVELKKINGGRHSIDWTDSLAKGLKNSEVIEVLTTVQNSEIARAETGRAFADNVDIFVTHLRQDNGKPFDVAGDGQTLVAIFQWKIWLEREAKRASARGSESAPSDASVPSPVLAPAPAAPVVVPGNLSPEEGRQKGTMREFAIRLGLEVVGLDEGFRLFKGVARDVGLSAGRVLTLLTRAEDSGNEGLKGKASEMVRIVVNPRASVDERELKNGQGPRQKLMGAMVEFLRISYLLQSGKQLTFPGNIHVSPESVASYYVRKVASLVLSREDNVIVSPDAADGDTLIEVKSMELDDVFLTTVVKLLQNLRTMNDGIGIANYQQMGSRLRQAMRRALNFVAQLARYKAYVDSHPNGMLELHIFTGNLATDNFINTIVRYFGEARIRIVLTDDVNQTGTVRYEPVISR